MTISSSKFCSNFYSPFRKAIGSEKNLGNSSKSTYQIDFRNRREAIKESLEDIEEGSQEAAMREDDGNNLTSTGIGSVIPLVV